MRRFRFSYTLVFILLLTGCTQSEQKKIVKTIQGSWQLVDISKKGNEPLKGEDKLLKKARDKKQLQDGAVVSFFKDGTLTEVNGTGAYLQGKWHSIYNGRALTITHDKVTDTILIELAVEHKNQILRISGKDSLQVSTYVHYTSPMKDLQEDPFHPSNNLWRLKPAQPETTKQLHERLANYFRHLAYILNAAKERKQDIVSFEYSQGPVKIYNGGIGIQPLPIVSASWVNTYYDSTEALLAYHMYEGYLRKSQYKAGGVGNWIEDDYNILLSIYAAAKEGEFPKLNKQ